MESYVSEQGPVEQESHDHSSSARNIGRRALRRQTPTADEVVEREASYGVLRAKTVERAPTQAELQTAELEKNSLARRVEELRLLEGFAVNNGHLDPAHTSGNIALHLDRGEHAGTREALHHWALYFADYLRDVYSNAAAIGSGTLTTPEDIHVVAEMSRKLLSQAQRTVDAHFGE